MDQCRSTYAQAYARRSVYSGTAVTRTGSRKLLPQQLSWKAWLLTVEMKRDGTAAAVSANGQSGVGQRDGPQATSIRCPSAIRRTRAEYLDS